MVKEIELLAPARNLETGLAAITHGADAVYIAAEKFGAREKAGNPVSDIEKLALFAHSYHARVYVTINTILFDNELPEAESLIKKVYDAGADAIIIQDFSILNMNIPPIALHASTQMHNNTPEKIRFLEDYGISRVVLPREMSISEITAIRGTTECDLEFFIHGALCVSYSGQCYMSQEITGRSANRGACSQPCRGTYDLINEDDKVLISNKHLLSLKDLNLSNHLHELIGAGITSFKIEGRMKDIDYVKNVVAHYNILLNNIISNLPGYKRASSGDSSYSFIPNPDRSFNRQFTEHFISGRTRNQASFNTQKSVGMLLGIVTNVTNGWLALDTEELVSNGDGLCFFSDDDKLEGFYVNKVSEGKIFPHQPQPELKQGMKLFRNHDHAFTRQLDGSSAKRSIKVSISIIQENNNFIFRAVDADNNTNEVIVPDSFEPAKNAELAKNNLGLQFLKSGDTIFNVVEVKSELLQKIPFIPVSRLNSVRRELLNKLEKNRIILHKKPERTKKNTITPYPESGQDYKNNISNNRSREFMKSAGLAEPGQAYEIKNPSGKVELMTTKYCLKYELGICPSKQDGNPTGKLYLRDNHSRFPLEFDCQNCVMKVLKPE